MTRLSPSVLVIEGRFYEDISAELAKGALAALEEAGASVQRVAVPGALEIPQALAFAVRAGLTPFGATRWRYHGAVALGCVIRGETSHYDIVAGESARALMTIATTCGRSGRQRHTDCRKPVTSLGKSLHNKGKQGC